MLSPLVRPPPGCCHKVRVRCWQPLSPRRGPLRQCLAALQSLEKSKVSWELFPLFSTPGRYPQPGTLGEMGGGSSV